MLKIGKLDNELLKKIVLDKIKYKNPEVLVKPNIGEDCATIDFGDMDCVISTDPITAAINQIGSLAVHITCNDIASNGVKPLGIMIAAMLPVGTTEQDIENIMEQAGNTAESLEVEIIGGHTEITNAVNKPIIVSTAIGKSSKRNEEKIMPGDLIFITKRAGIEGTGIIAADYGESLSDILTHEEIEKAKGFLDEISVVKEGVIGGEVGVSSMHDVTEGGILGALWETCQVANLGALIQEEKIPVDDVTKKIADKFNLDYLRLISSGSMLITARPEKRDLLLKEIANEGVSIVEIGTVEHRAKGIKMKKGEDVIDINPPKSDELYKVIK